MSGGAFILPTVVKICDLWTTDAPFEVGGGLFIVLAKACLLFFKN